MAGRSVALPPQMITTSSLPAIDAASARGITGREGVIGLTAEGSRRVKSAESSISGHFAAAYSTALPRLP